MRISFIFSSKSFSCLPAVFLIGVALLPLGCHPAITDPKDPRFILAEKDGWTVTRGELDAAIDNYRKQQPKMYAYMPPVSRPLFETGMLNNLVFTKMILKKADPMQLKDVDAEETTALNSIRSRYPTEDELQKQLQKAGLTFEELKKNIHDDIVIRHVLEAEAYHDIEPTRQEIDAFYLKNKQYYVTPPKIRASRIVILIDPTTSPADKAAKKRIIDRAHDRVVHGEDFGKVAAEVSDDHTSAPQGGDMGFFSKNANDPVFDMFAFNTKQGEISPVFETFQIPRGYQFLKVTGTQPEETIPEEQILPTITNYLRQVKKSEQAQAYKEKILADKGIVFHFTRVTSLPQMQPNRSPNGTSPTTSPPPTNGLTQPH
jgi:parvulin-like peptidyl-prolyl isomerase